MAQAGDDRSDNDDAADDERAMASAAPGPTGVPAQPDEEAAALEGTIPLAYASRGTEPPPGDRLFRAGTLVYTSTGIVVLFCWLLFGDFALYMRERSVQPTVQLFLKSLNASNTTMSMLMVFIPPAISLLLSPVISYRSDRLRSRWGRRIPFLIIPTPIAALAMVVIAFSPRIGGALHAAVGGAWSQNTWTLIVFGIAWTVFEVAAITSMAVLGGLINDVVPRGRLGRFFGLFRMVNLLDGFLFNWFLLKFAETHFTLMFSLIALLFGGGFILMCLNVREGEYPPPPPVTDDDRGLDAWIRRLVGAVRIYFRECFSQPYYLWCFGAFTLGTLSFLPINAFSVYYAKSLNMDMDFYGKLVGGSYVVSMALAYPIGWCVDRYHSLRVGLVTLTLYLCAAIYGILVIRDPLTFGIALVAHTVLSGSYFTATASITQALLPRSKFAQFASAGVMVTSLAQMVVGPGLGIILDATGSYYRLTFVGSLIISMLAIAVMFVVYRQFLARGGIEGYVAPGDEFAEAAPQPAVGH